MKLLSSLKCLLLSHKDCHIHLPRKILPSRGALCWTVFPAVIVVRVPIREWARAPLPSRCSPKFVHTPLPSRPASRGEKSQPTSDCIALVPPFYKMKLPKTNLDSFRDSNTIQGQRNIHSQNQFSWLLQHPNICFKTSALNKHLKMDVSTVMY